jgi:CBS domain-containing protein
MSAKIESGETQLLAQDRAGDAPKANLFERLRVMLGLAPASVREDIEVALEETAGDVTPQERALLKNVLGLHELRVADAMIPRADIIAVPASATLREVLRVFRANGHSRLPVYGETLDDPRFRRLSRAMRGKISRNRRAARARRRLDRLRRAAGDRRRFAPRVIRAALDAGARSTRADAGDAHPYGAGHRRIWRHRWPCFH